MAPPVPEPSSLTTLLKTHTPLSLPSSAIPLHHLALQIAHNLKYAHSWTALRIHYPSNQPHNPTSSSSLSSGAGREARPLLSGRPPKRLYVHPDEQIEFLQRQHDAASGGGGKDVGSNGTKTAPTEALSEELAPEREWVLPCHLREKWSLRQMAGVFDSISQCVPTGDVYTDDDRFQDGEGVLFDDEDEDEGDAGESNEWRTKMPKRLLMAILEDDSTVVYYVVHDGVVKPRQN